MFYSVDVYFTVFDFHSRSEKLFQQIQNLKTVQEVEPSSFVQRVHHSEYLPNIFLSGHGLSDMATSITKC